jgi:hypothetical protein
LRGVEHCDAFEEGNGAGFVAFYMTLLVLLFGHELVGIVYGLTALALADAAASRERLPKGQPIL